MKASYNLLQSYFSDPLPQPDELAALLTEHVFEVESVDKVGDDTVFEFKVLPDRAHYLLGHRGLAREIGVITKLAFSYREREHLETDASVAAVGVSIASDLCRRYMARRMEGIVAGDSPQWLQERLAALGQKSINAVVDAGNLVMLDIGQPLHVFDADRVRGGIVVRLAFENEEIELLTGEVAKLTVRDLVIADDEGPLAIAGVKGGKRAGVSAGTRDVIIEAANFEPGTVRRTSTRLNLRNESSKRFENEITPEFAEEGMKRIAELISELSGGAARSGPVTDVYPAARKAVPFLVRADDVSAMLGEHVGSEEIVELLERMDCAVEVSGEDIRVTPPSDRFDLIIPEDVADEVGRMRGYNRLLGVMPPALVEAQEQDPLFWYGERLKSVLVGRGYSEVLLYSFGPAGTVEIEYPLASDKAWLREDLSERMEEKLAFNRKNADLLGLDAIRICEAGKVFPQTGGERASFAFGIALTRKRKGESAEGILREDLHALSDALGVGLPTHSMRNVDHGAICEIDLSALLEQLPKPGTLAELGFTHLEGDMRYRPIVPYPFVTRDVAVFVPEGTAREEVHETIVSHAGPLRVRSWVFDEFVKVEDDIARHSFAFRIVFQSPERTLEDKEVNEVMQDVEGALRDAGWEVR